MDIFTLLEKGRQNSTRSSPGEDTHSGEGFLALARRESVSIVTLPQALAARKSVIWTAREAHQVRFASLLPSPQEQ